MKSEILISEMVWSYAGVRWSKPKGEFGQLTFKWPVITGITAAFFLLGFWLG